MAAVHLGLELYARKPVGLALGSFFATWLSLESGELRRSVGRDEYHLAVDIDQGCRLAATGRLCVCQLRTEQIGLGPTQATRAVLCPVSHRPAGLVTLGLRTNVFRDLGALSAGASFRLIAAPLGAVELVLPDTRAEAIMPAPGRFAVRIHFVDADLHP